MKLKRILPITLSFLMLFGCSSSKTESTSEENKTEEINGNYFNLEYDSSEIDKNLAETIETYFYAIQNVDYDLYVSTLYPDYVENMNSFLEENYSYDLETVVSELNDMLIEDAGAYLDTSEAYDADASYEITSIELELYEEETSTEEDATEFDPLSQYSSLFGDDFAENINKNADDVIDVYFSIKAICNGESEEYLLTDNELIVIKEGNDYYLIG